jgi:hypothetical protein
MQTVVSFVTGCELEGLLFVCYMRQVAAEDGWRNVIHGCKEDGKNKRLDEDKTRDAKEEEEGCQVEERIVFGW